MKKRCEHESLCIPFTTLCRETDLGYYGHVQSWSRVDYLLQEPDRFREFLKGVLGTPTRERQIQALAEAYEVTPEEFDEQWRKWAIKNYR